MKAYSYDLRVRIYNYSLTHTIRETAEVFSVSPDTVHLLRKLYRETGSLHPRDCSQERPRLITPAGETYLKLLLAEEVDLTLEEIRHRYNNAFGILVSIGTLWNTLNRLNITLKKKTFYDPKKITDEVKLETEVYDKTVKTIEPEKRFYLDETGTCLNMSLLYGRSIQGKRVYDKKPTSPGKRISTIAVLTIDGIKAEYSYMGSLNANLFIFYLGTFVLPILNDGQTLIMDNHPVHHAEAVQDYLKNNNIKFLFLPRYSPNLNPIEEAFSKIKQYIKNRRHEQ